jgi:hypothetical protein
MQVTEFPDSSIGMRFRFLVKVVTDYGFKVSEVSESMILADVPDKPSAAPTR